MAQGQGFFKGEKKKKKKGSQINSGGSYAPVFVPPTIVGKNKKQGE